MKQTASTKKRAKEKTGKKTTLRKKIDEFNDLCTTCIHKDGCVNATDRTRPIHQCEEFDSYTPAVAEPETETQPVEAKPADPGKYSGICINCDHRETCAHSTTEGGIWHCEEYS